MTNSLDEADRMLDSMADSQKIAEWYFLKGMIASKKGWGEQAFQYIQRAVQMNPGNPEYTAAYQNIMRARQYGAGGAYNQPNQQYVVAICVPV